jgi:alpha-tubulin suppressor-like RCC1 family protein
VAYEIVSVSCGARHTLAAARVWDTAARAGGSGGGGALSPGEVYAWGCNARGQLGRPQAPDAHPSPRFVQVWGPCQARGGVFETILV